MAATDGQIVIAAARWSSAEALSLRDFLAQPAVRAEQQQGASECPPPRCELVKFVRGQFASLGVPNLPNPSLHSHAVLTSLGKTLKVAAQSVKFKDGKRSSSVSSGVRFSIPESYPGYFEILSEEGKAVKCIESVSELNKKFPESVLLRENIRGFVSSVPMQELSADKSRTINSGEVLTLHKEVTLSRSSRSHKFLQCTDSRGDMVYISLEQRGKFSPIAHNDNISGVHTLRQLITNKRLPLMVRLVWGPAPAKHPACAELRLLAAYEEESVFALPLGLQHKQAELQASAVVALPVASCALKLVRTRNVAELQQTEHFQRLASTAVRLAKDINAKMTVLETFKDSISFWNISPNHSKHAGAKVSSKNYFMRRSVSTESQIVVSPLIKEEPEVVVAPTQDFLEIDQIYDYVRGFAPLPKNLQRSSPEGVIAGSEAPKPPPIETIPTNKQNVPSEKRTRKTDKQKIIKPSKTALKMELHAQNLAHESLRSSEKSRHEKRLFKSKTTSSLADYIQLGALTESPVDGEALPCVDLSSTHVLTQADLSAPQSSNCVSEDSLDEPSSLQSVWRDPDLEPTYENTTQVYLECDNDIRSTAKPLDSKNLYGKQKATSEIAHSLRKVSPNHFRREVNHRHESSKYFNKKKMPNDYKKTSKSHEDLVVKRREICSNFAQSSPGSSPQPGSPSSMGEAPLYTSLTNLRAAAATSGAASAGGTVAPAPPKETEERKARRRRLSKQRSLSSLIAGETRGDIVSIQQAPHSPPVIEHRPVEVHLHLSSSRASQASHRHRGSRPERTSAKLGILYL